MNGQVGPFEKFDKPESFAEFCARVCAMPDVAAAMKPQGLRRLYEESQRMTHYRDATYHVALLKDEEHGFPGAIVWHLSIKRHDRGVIMDWRDLQAIKTTICGAEAEAVQLFPAESRVVDTSNQYHLFAFMKMGGKKLPRFPVGWSTGARTDEPGGAAVQRPR